MTYYQNQFRIDPLWNIFDHLNRQRDFSRDTFGPGARVAGVVDHIREELTELEADPYDLEEWIDIIILGFDGALRQGYSPEKIVATWIAKQKKNEEREWPDWRTQPEDKAIGHTEADEPAEPVIWTADNGQKITPWMVVDVWPVVTLDRDYQVYAHVFVNKSSDDETVRFTCEDRREQTMLLARLQEAAERNQE